MARARNIKPGFFTNDVLAEIHPLGRILFAGLWTIADREGRLEDRPKKIKAEVLPFDNCNVEKLLSEISQRGFITRYVVDGIAYIQITNWKKHQNPHIKEAESTIPAPVKHSASTVQAPDKEQPKPERAGLIPDSLNLIPDSKKNTTSTTDTSPPVQPPESSSSSESAEAGKGKRPLGWAVWGWEKERGKMARSFIGGSEQVSAWEAAGVTEAQLRQAYDLAVAQREADKDPAPINVKFLHLFVAKVLNPREAGSAVTVKAWYESAPGIEAKGRELGIDPPDPLHGGFPAFKARVFAAAGLTAEA